MCWPCSPRADGAAAFTSARAGHPPSGDKIGGVERFTDRLRGGKLRPYTPDVLGDPVEYENAVREQVSEEFILRNHRAPTMAELGELTRFAMEHSPVRNSAESGYQVRRSTATTLPTILALSPGIGS